MKYLLFYESSDDAREKAPLHIVAHRARWKEFADRGALLMVGPFGDASGALGIFTSREAAEDFAKGDPFVINGVTRRWYIRDWREALVGPV